MILFQPTAWLGGSVLAARVQVTQNTPTSLAQKRATQTLQFFTEPAASIAFTVRTGIIGT